MEYKIIFACVAFSLFFAWIILKHLKSHESNQEGLLNKFLLISLIFELIKFFFITKLSEESTLNPDYTAISLLSITIIMNLYISYGNSKIIHYLKPFAYYSIFSCLLFYILRFDSVMHAKDQYYFYAALSFLQIALLLVYSIKKIKDEVWERNSLVKYIVILTIYLITIALLNYSWNTNIIFIQNSNEQIKFLLDIFKNTWLINSLIALVLYSAIIPIFCLSKRGNK